MLDVTLNTSSLPGITPLVSVILPTHNRAHLLPRALCSVLCQTGVEFEVICINDASTDGTDQVLQHFDDRRIFYIKHATRMGAAAARNTGIRASRGAWIAFLDSDDEWLPGLLATQMERFKQLGPQVGVVYAGFERYTGRFRRRIPGRLHILLSHIPSARHRISGDLTRALERGNFITLQSAMIRRTCFDQVGFFDENLPRLQDWEFWLRLAPHALFSWIDQPLVRVYTTPGSISGTSKALLEALEMIMKKHATDSPELAAHIHFILGDLHMHIGNTRLGLTNLKQALRGSPTTLAYWMAWLVAAASPRLYCKIADQPGFGYTQG